MAKKMKKLVALMLVIAMMMSFSVTASAKYTIQELLYMDPTGTVAEEPAKGGSNDGALGKTAEWADESQTIADVTLSVPGESQAIGADIVFIMGSNEATHRKILGDLKNTIEAILAEFGDSGATVKVGFVTYHDADELVMPLTEINAETDIDALFDQAHAAFSAYGAKNAFGINMEGTLLEAKKMLDADTTVPADRKHMIIISSGLTYFFDNEDGETTTILGTDSNGDPCWNNKSWLAIRNGLRNTSSGYPIPFGWDWDTYWEHIVEWVEADGDTYEFTPEGGYLAFRDANNTENNSIRYGYQVKADSAYREAAMAAKVPFCGKNVNPDTSLEGQTPAMQEQIINANHALNYERAWYDAWLAYTAMEEAGYHCYSIMNGKELWLDQAGNAFMDHLAGDDAPILTEVENYFDPIRQEILYSVGAGSYVEDVMGYGEDYNFDFMVDGKITMKVGDVTYNTTKLTTAKEGFDASYIFTAPGAETETFTLDYVKGTQPADEKFIWTFGEDVSNYAPVVLDYQVKLVEKPAEITEDLLVNTNKEANLYNPEGEELGEFPVPQLPIEMPKDEEAEAEGPSRNKTAEWAAGLKDIANVTLSVPGEVTIEGADIVFLIDKSSCGAYATEQFKEMFQELAAVQAQSGTNIKVGVIVFNYTDHVDIPLTELTSDNVDELLGMLGTHSGGTNIEAALQAANEMLAADDTVSAANKHVVLISDGLTWVYDDAEGIPSTILWKSGSTVYSGTTSYSEPRNVSGYQIPKGYTWDTYWAQIKKWVEADNNAYDYNIPDYDLNKTDAWKAKLQSQGQAFALTTAEAQNHAVSMDRAMYDAWLAYTALQDAGYNCYVNNLNQNTKTNGYNFMNMLADGQSAVDFESIKNTIIYAVRAGSYVEDVMGYGEDYNFDFMVDGKITMKVGDVEYTTTKLDAAKEGFDASYIFTAPGAETETFTLDYVKGTQPADEKFIWTFGEDVSNFAPVVLDYQVKLVEKPAEITEDLLVNTNKEANLYNPEGEKLGEFPVPQLPVFVPEYTVTYVAGNTVLETYSELQSGADIPGFAGEEPEKTGFSFEGWTLTSGTPDGNKIGSTDLVYTAKFALLTGEDDTIIEDEEVPLGPIPTLFSDDHYAYIIGYPDGLVHPEGNITRAEVATIFFRLLDEEIRAAEMVSENQFTDVNKGQWYNNAVSTLASMGILLGKGDGTYFAPDDYITRAEFAAIAARFDPMGETEGQFFTDIAGHWAEKEIMIAANNGWVKGENGKFRPDDNITRAEAVTLINRVLHRLPETKEDLLANMVIWPDNMDESAWYYLAMQEATNSHDYARKPNPDYETWTQFRDPYDWSLLEY